MKYVKGAFPINTHQSNTNLGRVRRRHGVTQPKNTRNDRQQYSTLALGLGSSPKPRFVLDLRKNTQGQGLVSLEHTIIEVFSDGPRGENGEGGEALPRRSKGHTRGRLAPAEEVVDDVWRGGGEVTQGELILPNLVGQRASDEEMFHSLHALLQ